MPETTLNIKKIKLSDGNIYSIFDNGALRLNENHILITGNEIVDEVILQGHLYITEIDDVPVEDSIDNVLVQDTTTGEVLKRSVNYVLKDIGGFSASVNEETDTLTLKLGK